MRHPPVGVPPGRCYGRSEVPLLPGWRGSLPGLAEQAAAVRPVRVLSSPTGRCLIPARLLARRLRVPVLVDHDLRELDFGDWEGLDWDSVPREQLDLWAADPLGFAPPGGESGLALLTRIGRFVDGLRRVGGNVVVMTHGGPLRVLPSLLRREAPDLSRPAPAMGSLDVVNLS